MNDAIPTVYPDAISLKIGDPIIVTSELSFYHACVGHVVRMMVAGPIEVLLNAYPESLCFEHSELRRYAGAS